MWWLHYYSNVAECPDDWVAYNAGQRCYKFKAVPTARYEAANAMCVVSIITSVTILIMYLGVRYAWSQYAKLVSIF